MLTERENMLRVIRGEQPEWVPDYEAACVTVRQKAIGMRKDPETGHMVDIFGVHFVNAPDGIMAVTDGQGRYVMDDITKWREYMPKIDLDQIDWEAEGNWCRAQMEKAQGEGSASEKVSCLFGYGKTWEEMHYMMGFEEAFTALVEEPEECAEFLMTLADFEVEAFHRLCKYYKPDMALLMDHFAVEKSLMMSPAVYREIIKPAQAKIVKAFKEEGVIAQLHTDGMIEQVLPDLKEIGIDVIQPFQICNDLERAKEKYGFICVGGWDSHGPGNQPDATEEEVRKSVRVAMDTYAPTGRYIFWNSGVTGRDQDKMVWTMDEARIYGHAFYKGK